MQHNIFSTMRSLKMMEGCKGTQVYALNPSGTMPLIHLEQQQLMDSVVAAAVLEVSYVARLHVVDVHTKVVLSAWLRFERREDELIGVSAMDCCGRSMECPGSALVAGYNPESATDPCMCHRGKDAEIYMDEECSTSSSRGIEEEEDFDMSFCIGVDEIRCRRFNIASLSRPFEVLLSDRCIVKEKRKTVDLSAASELDPTLSYPYKYRAVSKEEENKLGPAISEINKVLGFKISPDCLELRAWFLIALEDNEGALRDVRALLTLDPHYMMFHGKLPGEHLVELLSHNVQPCSQADCWMQLNDRWSSVDDIGSLAVVHHMLANE
ncbi:hypothetical protein P3S68_009248 [Capsicum galapagoense]